MALGELYRHECTVESKLSEAIRKMIDQVKPTVARPCRVTRAMFQELKSTVETLGVNFQELKELALELKEGSERKVLAIHAVKGFEGDVLQIEGNFKKFSEECEIVEEKIIPQQKGMLGIDVAEFEIKSDGVTFSIGKGFELKECRLDESVTTVIVPDIVRAISYMAFPRWVTHIHLNDNLQEINPFSFGFTKIESLIIPPGVQKCGSLAQCGKLKVLQLPLCRTALNDKRGIGSFALNTYKIIGNVNYPLTDVPQNIEFVKFSLYYDLKSFSNEHIDGLAKRYCSYLCSIFKEVFGLPVELIDMILLKACTVVTVKRDDQILQAMSLWLSDEDVTKSMSLLGSGKAVKFVKDELKEEQSVSESQCVIN